MELVNLLWIFVFAGALALIGFSESVIEVWLSITLFSALLSFGHELVLEANIAIVMLIGACILGGLGRASANTVANFSIARWQENPWENAD